MTQSSDVALTHATTTATALGIIIPANSQIVNMNYRSRSIIHSFFYNYNCYWKCLGTPTNIAAAGNVSATAGGPLKMLQLQLELGTRVAN